MVSSQDYVLSHATFHSDSASGTFTTNAAGEPDWSVTM